MAAELAAGAGSGPANRSAPALLLLLGPGRQGAAQGQLRAA